MRETVTIKVEELSYGEVGLSSVLGGGCHIF